jgi:hypothetical protein
MFVAYKDQHTEGGSTDICHLARWDGGGKMVTLRTISAQPAGKFIKMALHTCPEDTPLLPGAGPWILMWGAGKYRESDVYLASFASGAGTLYFAGLSAGRPKFTTHEGGARAVVQNGTVGDVSVTYMRELEQWIMLYDSRTPRGVVFRHSAVPWGPFSDEQTIFNAKDGLGTFIHDPAREPPDGLAGPVIGAKTRSRARRGLCALCCSEVDEAQRQHVDDLFSAVHLEPLHGRSDAERIPGPALMAPCPMFPLCVSYCSKPIQRTSPNYVLQRADRSRYGWQSHASTRRPWTWVVWKSASITSIMRTDAAVPSSRTRENGLLLEKPGKPPLSASRPDASFVHGQC